MGLPFPQPSGVNVFDGEYKQATVINRVLNRLLSNDKYVAQTVENVELTALDVTFAPGSAIRQIHQRGNNYYSMAVTSSLSSRPFSLNDLEKLNPIFLLLPVLLPSKLKIEFLPSLDIPNESVLEILPFSFFKKGFSAPPEIVVLPFFILIVAFGTDTSGSSYKSIPPPMVVSFNVFFK